MILPHTRSTGKNDDVVVCSLFSSPAGRSHRIADTSFHSTSVSVLFTVTFIKNKNQWNFRRRRERELAIKTLLLDSAVKGGGAAAKDQLGDAQHLFVIRHGDRWDYENPTAWRSHPFARKGDPSLSSLGHQQARETGQYLNALFQNLSIAAGDITWMSSPFLRTFQTSTQALNSLNFDGSELIPILPEFSVFEWDGSDGEEWHASLPELTERVHYFPRLLYSATTYKSLLHPTLPEPQPKFQDRCQKTIKAINNRHHYKPKSALVVVTHAAVCIGLVAEASGKDYTDITPAAACSIYQLSRWKDEPFWHLDQHNAPESMNGFTNHLSKSGRTTPWHHFGDEKINGGYSGPPSSRFAPENMAQQIGS